jgi:NAD(P)-dependent dehydrogenase (short-subunit alcohol dehydrogenase family)
MSQLNVNSFNQREKGKLINKIALITGGDSSLGRAVAIAFAKEGADVAITYLNNQKNAEQTKQIVEQEGHSCLVISGDVREEAFCHKAVQETINTYEKLDILVNNAVQLQSLEKLETLKNQQLESDLDSNICAMFYMTNAAEPYLKEGSVIINTTSVTSYQGHDPLLGYSASKGAIMTFTRSSSPTLQEKGIRVNGVAPGPVWTLQVPTSLTADQVEEFDNQLPKGQIIEPEEIAASFVFLASDESAYMAGQILFTQTHF